MVWLWILLSYSQMDRISKPSDRRLWRYILVRRSATRKLQPLYMTSWYTPIRFMLVGCRGSPSLSLWLWVCSNNRARSLTRWLQQFIDIARVYLCYTVSKPVSFAALCWFWATRPLWYQLENIIRCTQKKAWDSPKGYLVYHILGTPLENAGSIWLIYQIDLGLFISLESWMKDFSLSATRWAVVNDNHKPGSMKMCENQLLFC